MDSTGSPQNWVPYDNPKDCTQGFCSLYCPQWCYIIFPPPPPFGFPDEDSSTNFSPLVIAIIGILASALLLVSYYTVISKYCGNLDSLRRRRNRDQNEEFSESQNPSQQEPWQVSTNGLDEALIKSITVCKYKKGDGLVEGTDCSVCLSEFQEDESLRLLPKCSHAFHLTCIDTWLKSHSNCPLCRANIVSNSPSELQLLPPVQENPPNGSEIHTVVVVEDLERNDEEVGTSSAIVPKTPSRVHSDLEESDTIIEIRDEGVQQIRRSFSMGSCQARVSIADILCMSEDDGSQTVGLEFQMHVGSPSKRPFGEHGKFNNRSRGLHCVMSPTSMKRSFSSGRFLLNRQGRRGRNLL